LAVGFCTKNLAFARKIITLPESGELQSCSPLARTPMPLNGNYMSEQGTALSTMLVFDLHLFVLSHSVDFLLFSLYFRYWFFPNFWIRNWSTIAARLVLLLVVFVWVTSSKKAQGSIVSNWIRIKFGGIVRLVNMHQLMELHYWYVWRHTFKMVAVASFHEKA